jgi:hypothetical protein
VPLLRHTQPVRHGLHVAPHARQVSCGAVHHARRVSQRSVQGSAEQLPRQHRAVRCLQAGQHDVGAQLAQLLQVQVVHAQAVLQQRLRQRGAQLRHLLHRGCRGAHQGVHLAHRHLVPKAAGCQGGQVLDLRRIALQREKGRQVSSACALSVQEVRSPVDCRGAWLASCERPTRRCCSPRATTVSVADGSRETTRSCAAAIAARCAASPAAGLCHRQRQ